jgi:hypothetical protein
MSVEEIVDFEGKYVELRVAVLDLLDAMSGSERDTDRIYEARKLLGELVQ